MEQEGVGARPEGRSSLSGQVTVAADAVTDLPLRHAAVLARAVRDLKSVVDARGPESVADRLFECAWRALLAGASPGIVASAITARALAATQLGGIDAQVLALAGLDAAAVARVHQDALAASLPLVPPALHEALCAGLRTPLATADAPRFVAQLARQPRAGATSPGKPRVILAPAESHAGHCLAVAVLGVLLAPGDAAREVVFLAGLSHHLHNALLPDSGFAGEMLLGDRLDVVLATLREAGLAQLPPPLAQACRAALLRCVDAATPEGRALNAADVIDRVEEMRHHARVSAFRVEDALDELELVHAGPLQRFHHAVLAEAGLA